MSLAASYCIIRDIEGEATILLLCLRWGLPYHTGAFQGRALVHDNLAPCLNLKGGPLV